MLDKELVSRINGLQLSDRVVQYKKAFFDEKTWIGADRGELAVESWKETEGEHIELRRAKLMKKILENISVVIHPGQLLVGGETKHLRGVTPYVDYESYYLAELMQEGRITLGGPRNQGIFSDEDWQSLEKQVKYFDGAMGTRQKLKQLTEAVMGNWYEDLIEARGTHRYEDHPPAVIGRPQYEKLLSVGVRGIIKEIEERRKQFIENHESDAEKLYFWDAALICCKAIIAYANRYAKLAQEMAGKEKDPTWRSELQDIAEVCRRVPENPARTLREALQSFVFMVCALKLEAPCYGAASWGLPDQYFYSYFAQDLKEGRGSLEKTADLIVDWLLFASRNEWIQEKKWREHIQTQYVFQNLAIGGPTRTGEDATNELSWLILHMAGLLKLPEPHVAIRWHKQTPHELILKGIEVNGKVSGGVPQFQNSEHAVQWMMSKGFSLEDSREWGNNGCSQMLPSSQCTYLQVIYLTTPLAVDLALHNGVAPMTGKQIGPQTGDPRGFKTFDDFYEAFKKQWEFMTSRVLWRNNLVYWAAVSMYRQPLASCFSPGCIEKGRSVTAGGQSHYNIGYTKDRGLVDVADSLTAVKKLVFEEKKLTMDELLSALDSNFAGDKGEEIRRMCLTAPKYGNDIDEPDFMLRDVAKFTSGVVMQQKNPFGLPYCINRNGQAWHFKAGKGTGALPNGRKAGTPFADASLSPSGGVDTHGPTAVIRSALKADFKESGMAIFNQKFPASIARSPESREKLAVLTETYFKQGGSYIQYNILDKATLIEAKRNPEKYRDLVVRVGGYSAFFVTLSPEVQDEIINRTEQSL